MQRHARLRLPDWARRKVAWRQQWRCVDCLGMLDWAFEVDHRVPLSQGGTNAESNLAACCACCHAKKSIEEASAWCAACGEDRRGCGCVGREVDFGWARMSRSCRRCGAVYSNYFSHACSSADSSAGEDAIGEDAIGAATRGDEGGDEGG